MVLEYVFTSLAFLQNRQQQSFQAATFVSERKLMLLIFCDHSFDVQEKKLMVSMRSRRSQEGTAQRFQKRNRSQLWTEFMYDLVSDFFLLNCQPHKLWSSVSKVRLEHLFSTLMGKDAERIHRRQKIAILVLSFNSFIEFNVLYLLYAVKFTHIQFVGF